MDNDNVFLKKACRWLLIAGFTTLVTGVSIPLNNWPLLKFHYNELNLQKARDSIEVKYLQKDLSTCSVSEKNKLSKQIETAQEEIKILGDGMIYAKAQARHYQNIGTIFSDVGTILLLMGLLILTPRMRRQVAACWSYNKLKTLFS